MNKEEAACKMFGHTDMIVNQQKEKIRCGRCGKDLPHNTVLKGKITIEM